MKKVLSLWKVIILIFVAFVGVAGVTVLSLYLMGRFDEKKVEPEDMAFEQVLAEGDGFYNYELSQYEVSSDTFKLLLSTTTEDVTETEVTLSLLGGREENGYISDGVIKVKKTVNIGMPFTVELEPSFDETLQKYLIMGGTSVLTAKSSNVTSKDYQKTIKIAVDCPVDDIEVKVSGKLEVAEMQNVIVGKPFTLETTFLPENSKNLFSDSSRQKHIFYANTTNYISYDWTNECFMANARSGQSGFDTITVYTFKNSYYQQQILDSLSYIEEQDSPEGREALTIAVLDHFKLHPETCVSKSIKIKVEDVTLTSNGFEVGSDLSHDLSFDKYFTITTNSSSADTSLDAKIKDDAGNSLPSMLGNIGLKIPTDNDEIENLSFEGGRLVKVEVLTGVSKPRITQIDFTSDLDTELAEGVEAVSYYLLPSSTPKYTEDYFWKFAVSSVNNADVSYQFKINFFYENDKNELVALLDFDQNGEYPEKTLVLNAKTNAQNIEEKLDWLEQTGISMTINYEENGESIAANADLSKYIGPVAEKNLYHTLRYFLVLPKGSTGDIKNHFVCGEGKRYSIDYQGVKLNMTNIQMEDNGTEGDFEDDYYVFYELDGSTLTAIKSFSGKAFVVAATIKTNADGVPYIDEQGRYLIVKISNGKEVYVSSSLSIANMLPSFELDDEIAFENEGESFVRAVTKNNSGDIMHPIKFVLTLKGDNLDAEDATSDISKLLRAFNTPSETSSLKVEVVTAAGVKSDKEYVTLENFRIATGGINTVAKTATFEGTLKINQNLFSNTETKDFGSYVALRLVYNNGSEVYTKQILSSDKSKDHFKIYYQQVETIKAVFEDDPNKKDGDGYHDIEVNVKTDGTFINWNGDLVGGAPQTPVDVLNSFLTFTMTDQFGKEIRNIDNAYSIKFEETSDKNILSFDETSSQIQNFKNTNGQSVETYLTAYVIEVVDGKEKKVGYFDATGNIVKDESQNIIPISSPTLKFVVTSESIKEIWYDANDYKTDSVGGNQTWTKNVLSDGSSDISNVKISRYVVAGDEFVFADVVRIYNQEMASVDAVRADTEIYIDDVEFTFDKTFLAELRENGVQLKKMFSEDNGIVLEDGEMAPDDITDLRNYADKKLKSIKFAYPFNDDNIELVFKATGKDGSLFDVTITLVCLPSVELNTSAFNNYEQNYKDYLVKSGNKISIFGDETFRFNDYITFNNLVDESRVSTGTLNWYFDASQKEYFTSIDPSVGVGEIVKDSSDWKLKVGNVYDYTNLSVKIYYGPKTDYSCSVSLEFYINPNIVVRQEVGEVGDVDTNLLLEDVETAQVSDSYSFHRLVNTAENGAGAYLDKNGVVKGFVDAGSSDSTEISVAVGYRNVNAPIEGGEQVSPSEYLLKIDDSGKILFANQNSDLKFVLGQPYSQIFDVIYTGASESTLKAVKIIEKEGTEYKKIVIDEIGVKLRYKFGLGFGDDQVLKKKDSTEKAQNIAYNGENYILLSPDTTYEIVLDEYTISSVSGSLRKSGSDIVTLRLNSGYINYANNEVVITKTFKDSTLASANTLNASVTIKAFISAIGNNFVYYNTEKSDPEETLSLDDLKYNKFEDKQLDEILYLTNENIYQKLLAGNTYTIVHNTDKTKREFIVNGATYYLTMEDAQSATNAQTASRNIYFGNYVSEPETYTNGDIVECYVDKDTTYYVVYDNTTDLNLDGTPDVNIDLGQETTKIGNTAGFYFSGNSSDAYGGLFSSQVKVSIDTTADGWIDGLATLEKYRDTDEYETLLKINHLSSDSKYENAYITLKFEIFKIANQAESFEWYYRIKVEPSFTLNDVKYPYADNAEYLNECHPEYDGSEYNIDLEKEFNYTNSKYDEGKRFATPMYNGAEISGVSSVYNIKNIKIGDQVVSGAVYFDLLELDGGKLKAKLKADATNTEIVLTITKTFFLNGQEMIGSAKDYVFKFNQGDVYTHALSAKVDGATAVSLEKTEDVYTHTIIAGQEIEYTADIKIKGDNNSYANVTSYNTYIKSLTEGIELKDALQSTRRYIKKGATYYLDETHVGDAAYEQTADHDMYTAFVYSSVVESGGSLDVYINSDDADVTTVFGIDPNKIGYEYYYLDSSKILHIQAQDSIPKDIDLEIGYYTSQKVAFKVNVNLKSYFNHVLNTSETQQADGKTFELKGGKTYKLLNVVDVDLDGDGDVESAPKSDSLFADLSTTTGTEITNVNVLLVNKDQAYGDVKLKDLIKVTLNMDNDPDGDPDTDDAWKWYEIEFAHMPNDAVFNFVVTLADVNGDYSFNVSLNVKADVNLDSERIFDQTTGETRYTNVGFDVESQDVYNATKDGVRIIDFANDGEDDSYRFVGGVETQNIIYEDYSDTVLYPTKDLNMQYSFESGASIIQSGHEIGIPGVTIFTNKIFDFVVKYKYKVGVSVDVENYHPAPDGTNEIEAEYISTNKELVTSGETEVVTYKSEIFENFFNNCAQYNLNIDDYGTERDAKRVEVSPLADVKDNDGNTLHPGDSGYEEKYFETIGENWTILVSNISNVKLISGATIITSSSANKTIIENELIKGAGKSIADRPNVNLQFEIENSQMDGEVTFLVVVNGVSTEYKVVVKVGSAYSVSTAAPNYTNTQELIYAEDLAKQDLNIFDSDRIVSFVAKTGAELGTYYLRFVNIANPNETRTPSIDILEAGETVNIDLGYSLTGYEYQGTYLKLEEAKTGGEGAKDAQLYEVAPKLTSRLIVYYAGTEIEFDKTVSTDSITLQLKERDLYNEDVKEYSYKDFGSGVVNVNSSNYLVVTDHYTKKTTVEAYILLGNDFVEENIINLNAIYSFYLDTELEVGNNANDVTSYSTIELDADGGTTPISLMDVANIYNKRSTDVDKNYGSDGLANSAGTIELKIYGFSDMKATLVNSDEEGRLAIQNTENQSDRLAMIAGYIHNYLINTEHAVEDSNVGIKYYTGIAPIYTMIVDGAVDYVDGFNVKTNANSFENYISIAGAESGKTTDYKIFANASNNDGNHVMMRLVYTVDINGSAVGGEIKKYFNILFKVVPNSELTFNARYDSPNYVEAAEEIHNYRSLISNYQQPFEIKKSTSVKDVILNLWNNENTDNNNQLSMIKALMYGENTNAADDFNYTIKLNNTIGEIIYNEYTEKSITNENAFSEFGDWLNNKVWKDDTKEYKDTEESQSYWTNNSGVWTHKVENNSTKLGIHVPEISLGSRDYMIEFENKYGFKGRFYFRYISELDPQILAVDTNNSVVKEGRNLAFVSNYYSMQSQMQAGTTEQILKVNGNKYLNYTVGDGSDPKVYFRNTIKLTNNTGLEPTLKVYADIERTGEGGQVNTVLAYKKLTKVIPDGDYYNIMTSETETGTWKYKDSTSINEKDIDVSQNELSESDNVYYTISFSGTPEGDPEMTYSVEYTNIGSRFDYKEESDLVKIQIYDARTDSNDQVVGEGDEKYSLSEYIDAGANNGKESMIIKATYTRNPNAITPEISDPNKNTDKVIISGLDALAFDKNTLFAIDKNTVQGLESDVNNVCVKTVEFYYEYDWIGSCDISTGATEAEIVTSDQYMFIDKIESGIPDVNPGQTGKIVESSDAEYGNNPDVFKVPYIEGLLFGTEKYLENVTMRVTLVDKGGFETAISEIVTIERAVDTEDVFESTTVRDGDSPKIKNDGSTPPTILNDTLEVDLAESADSNGDGIFENTSVTFMLHDKAIESVETTENGYLVTDADDNTFAPNLITLTNDKKYAITKYVGISANIVGLEENLDNDTNKYFYLYVFEDKGVDEFRYNGEEIAINTDIDAGTNLKEVVCKASLIDLIKVGEDLIDKLTVKFKDGGTTGRIWLSSKEIADADGVLKLQKAIYLNNTEVDGSGYPTNQTEITIAETNLNLAYGETFAEEMVESNSIYVYVDGDIDAVEYNGSGLTLVGKTKVRANGSGVKAIGIYDPITTNPALQLKIAHVDELLSGSTKTETLYFLYSAHDTTYQFVEMFNVKPQWDNANNYNTVDASTTAPNLSSLNNKFTVDDYMIMKNDTTEAKYYLIPLASWAKNIWLERESGGNIEYNKLIDYVTANGGAYKFYFKINSTLGGSAFIDENGLITTTENYDISTHQMAVDVYMKISGVNGKFEENSENLHLGTFRMNLDAITTIENDESTGTNLIDGNTITIPEGYKLWSKSDLSSTTFTGTLTDATQYSYQIGETFYFDEMFGHKTLSSIVLSEVTNKNYHIVKDTINTVSTYPHYNNLNSWSLLDKGVHTIDVLVTGRDGSAYVYYLIQDVTILIYDTDINEEKTEGLYQSGSNASVSDTLDQDSDYTWYVKNDDGTVTPIDDADTTIDGIQYVVNAVTGTTTTYIDGVIVKDFIAIHNSNGSIKNVRYTYFVYSAEEDHYVALKQDETLQFSELIVAGTGETYKFYDKDFNEITKISFSYGEHSTLDRTIYMLKTTATSDESLTKLSLTAKIVSGNATQHAIEGTDSEITLGKIEDLIKIDLDLLTASVTRADFYETEVDATTGNDVFKNKNVWTIERIDNHKLEEIGDIKDGDGMYYTRYLVSYRNADGVTRYYRYLFDFYVYESTHTLVKNVSANASYQLSNLNSEAKEKVFGATLTTEQEAYEVKYFKLENEVLKEFTTVNAEVGRLDNYLVKIGDKYYKFDIFIYTRTEEFVLFAGGSDPTEILKTKIRERFAISDQTTEIKFFEDATTAIEEKALSASADTVEEMLIVKVVDSWHYCKIVILNNTDSLDDFALEVDTLDDLDNKVKEKVFVDTTVDPADVLSAEEQSYEVKYFTLDDTVLTETEVSGDSGDTKEYYVLINDEFYDFDITFNIVVA